MSDPNSSSDSAEKAFLGELVKHRLLLETGVRGVFGRGQVFEDVLSHFDAHISAAVAGDGAERLAREVGLPASSLLTEASRSTWLARFGGQVAYVIGGSKDGDAQFWIFKDSWLPARMRWTDGGTRWDVRFVDYNSPAGDWFPRAVEVSRDGERQVRFTTLSGDPRATVPDRLF